MYNQPVTLVWRNHEPAWASYTIAFNAVQKITRNKPNKPTWATNEKPYMDKMTWSTANTTSNNYTYNCLKHLKKNNGKQTKYLQTNKLKQESNFKPTKPELSNRKTWHEPSDRHLARSSHYSHRLSTRSATTPPSPGVRCAEHKHTEI